MPKQKESKLVKKKPASSKKISRAVDKPKSPKNSKVVETPTQGNSNNLLRQASKAKKDEFYTQLSDIEKN